MNSNEGKTIEQIKEFSQYYSEILHFLKDVESYPNVKLIDLSKAMCTNSGCTTFDLNPLYLDKGHLILKGHFIFKGHAISFTTKLSIFKLQLTNLLNMV